MLTPPFNRWYITRFDIYILQTGSIGTSGIYQLESSKNYTKGKYAVPPGRRLNFMRRRVILKPFKIKMIYIYPLPSVRLGLIGKRFQIHAM